MDNNFEKHKGLVYFFLDKFLDRNPCYCCYKDELICEGFYGLYLAAKRYRKEYGYAFSTYAAKYINGNMRNYIRFISAKTYKGEPYIEPSSYDINYSKVDERDWIEWLLQSIENKHGKDYTKRMTMIKGYYLEGKSMASLAKENNISKQLVHRLIQDGLKILQRKIRR